MRRHLRRFKLIFAMSVTLAAIAAVPAAARFEGPVGTTAVLVKQSPLPSTNLCSEVCDAAIARPSAAVSHTHSSPQPRAGQSIDTSSSVARLAGHGGGFAWGDAGIGAGAAFAILVLILGASAAGARRRVGARG